MVTWWSCNFSIRKSIHTSSCKFIIYFIWKKLLFQFYTTTYIKHPHQFFYFTRYFNKIFTFLFFFIISLNCLPIYAQSHSLSLLIFPKLKTSLSLSLSLSFLPSLILSQKRPTQITSSPGPFFTGGSRFFLRRPILSSPATQILSF